MKIDGTGPIRPGTSPTRSKKVGDKGEKFAKHISESEDEATTAAVSSTGPLTAVDALLSLQEVPDATSGRSRGLKRAEDMLDHLDSIRHGLLLGSIPRDKLDGLLAVVREQREDIDDPRLAEVLDEIELRAAVELAKLDQLT